MIVLKSDRELKYMRDAGKITANALEEVKKAVAPEVSTQELDRIAEKYIQRSGAKAAFKGYHGFPGNICTSINEEVVHGIPGIRRLHQGDIVSIDVGVLINDYYGDAAVTVPVGSVAPEIEKLLNVTQAALTAGIEKAISGNRLGDISNAVQTVAELNGYGVVRDYVGHGIGRKMHEDPQIPNFGKPGQGPLLKTGMTMAIEPMINLGSYEVQTLEDNWTVVTVDAKVSAHFEHTIAITPNGPEVLTRL